MKIKKLLIKLAEVAKQNPEADVYISDGAYYYAFSGFSVDDNMDVLLDIVGGDSPA